MNIETLESLRDFVSSVKFSLSYETNLHVIQASEKLELLIDDEIKLKSETNLFLNDCNFPEILKSQA